VYMAIAANGNKTNRLAFIDAFIADQRDDQARRDGIRAEDRRRLQAVTVAQWESEATDTEQGSR
jgi:hypothetical protein